MNEQDKELNESVNEFREEMAGPLNPIAHSNVGHEVAIASMALNFAIKYHDMLMIPDGTLYQQYKMEGRNITSIGLSDVFETAIQIENHLMRGKHRVGAMVQRLALEILEDIITEPLTTEELAESEADDKADTTSTMGPDLDGKTRA